MPRNTLRPLIIFLLIFHFGIANAQIRNGYTPVTSVQLIADLNSVLSQEPFDSNRFCDRFWVSNSRDICYQLPWLYIRSITSSVTKAYPVGNGQSGFLDFLNLSYVCQRDSCFIGLDIPPVWDLFAVNWFKQPLHNGQISSVNPLNVNEITLLTEKIQQWTEKLSSLFAIQASTEHRIYWLNNASLATQTGFSYPSIVSGGSRGDYLVYVGEALPPSWLLHELVHTYTAYPGQWWHGTEHFPHAILTEGLAVWVQMQEIWNDGLPPQKLGLLLCNDLQVASKNMNGDILRLFDNDTFRIFDKDGYHPSYLIGASVINSLVNRLHLSGLRSFWNEIGRTTDPVKVALILNKVVSSKELDSELKTYFAQLADQVYTKTGVTCTLLQ